MSVLYTVVDQSHWKRAMHCAVFRNCIEPAFCITVELDVTHFYRRIKELGYPFTYSLIYLVSQAANEIEEFRYRFLEGQVVLYQRIHTAFTYLNPETELFKVVNVPLTDTLEEYVALADRTQKNSRSISPVPWGGTCFSFPPCPGCTTPTSPTPTPETRTTPPRCLTRENGKSGRESVCCSFPSRPTTPLWTGCMWPVWWKKFKIR